MQGTARANIQEVSCTGTTVQQAPGTPYRFHLGHDGSQSLPQKIGIVHNGANKTALGSGDCDPDFPDLKALLYFSGGQLHCKIQNDGSSAVSNLRVTYRLPLAWKEGICRRNIAQVSAHSSQDDFIAPTKAKDDYKYNSGYSYFLAQMDFTYSGARGRIYADCRFQNPDRGADHSYPSGGFTRLGAIPKGAMSLISLIAEVEAGKVPMTGGYTLPNSQVVNWVAAEGPFSPPYADIERIPLRTSDGGAHSWFFDDVSSWLMRCHLYSPLAQQARFVHDSSCLQRIYLNGARVTDIGQLAAGENTLLLIYQNATQYAIQNGGCFLRLVNPSTQARLTGISYETVSRRAP